VVIVEALSGEGSVAAFGSGVVVDSDRVVTNNHVVQEGSSFRVRHGARTWLATIIRVDSDHDLSLLKAEGLDAPAVPMRDSSGLAVGERVYAIGAPEGLELTLSEGLISALRGYREGRLIQTSAAISRGSSGGGLFDSQGKLVGITTFYIKEGQNLNFAIPAESVLVLKSHIGAKESPNDVGLRFGPRFHGWRWKDVGDFKCSSGTRAEEVEGIRAYQEALRIDPNDYLVWVWVGSRYRDVRANEQATRAYHEAIPIQPSDDLAWLDLAAAYSDMQRYDEAIAAYKTIVRLEHTTGDNFGWIRLAEVYSDMNRYDEAAVAY